MLNITSHKKVLKAKARVDKALNMFAKAHAEIEKANLHLAKAREDDLKKLAELQATIAHAEAEMEANNKVKAKLADFVK